MTSGIVIAAIVATKNRPELLANRSLASVAAQTRPPDFLIIVDDSAPKNRTLNEQIAAEFSSPGTTVVYLGNYRTAGASGAWNTALAWLHMHASDAFAAILDDDDAWSPAYLERCEQVAIDDNLDMVVAGLLYHRSAKDDGEPLTIPAQLRSDDFLVRNPHVQGSNLFVRLSAMLEAGTFDEALVSTTDRDLCVRLADLGHIRYGAVRQHLVHHFAELDRDRLSTLGSDSKMRGLSSFYRKHHGRMTELQRDEFVRRSRERFGVDPVVGEHPVALPTTEPPIDLDGELALLVGVITSPDLLPTSRLLGDLRQVFLERDDVRLKIVLLENGGAEKASRTALRELEAAEKAAGLDIRVVSLEQQRSDLGAKSDDIPGLKDRKSIALSRTMLQRRLYLEAKAMPATVVWILDDDIRLDGLTSVGGVGHEIQRPDYVASLKRLAKTDYGVVLGTVTGDPPLPFSSSIRTQLVDLYHNLEQMAALSPDDPYPDRSPENAAVRSEHRDYYYDLSRLETDHLETPFWYAPRRQRSTVGQTFEEMTPRLRDMIGGVQVFRPLVDQLRGDPLSLAVPSVNRGPSTLVLDMNALREFPNAVPTLDGSDTRRSDMIWSLLNRFVAGRKVVRIPVPVRQERRGAQSPTLDFEELAQDTQGYALYSCLHDVFLRKAQQRQLERDVPYGNDLLEFGPDDIKFALDRFDKYLRERMNAFELSYHRIVGLLKSFHRYFDTAHDGSHTRIWWVRGAEYRDAVDALVDFVLTMERIYGGFDLNDFRRRVLDVDSDQIASYLPGLRAIIDAYRSQLPLPKDRLIETAKQFVRDEFDAGSLDCLGVGEEGVALTDGRLVFKYFHYWKSRDRERQIQFLESLVDKWPNSHTLMPINEVRRRGAAVVLTYPFNPSRAYAGGLLDDIRTFLRECRQASIVCRNVHPDNFIVTDQRLKFIDYGSDMHPFNDEDYLHMCQRAFLMYRFHFRSDLRSLMRQALRDPDLPELAGFQHFMRALDPRSVETIVDPILRDVVGSLGPGSVLDYGCGKGKLAEALASEGFAVTGYDPDEAVIRRCRSYGSEVQHVDTTGLTTVQERSNRFDVVVCSLVLCTIEDPGELSRALEDIRSLTSDTGRVVVAVCNPFHTAIEQTEIQSRQLPEAARYEAAFTYRKVAGFTGRVRTDVHRPVEQYRQAFLKAGLVIEDTRESEGVDTVNLRPASDFLVFTLKAAPADGPSVSLLIKTCFQEWKIIERLVRHQVRQLERPRAFCEK